MTAYKKRVLALDVGEKRIGVAVSDPLGFSAQGVETIFTKGLENDLKRIRELSDNYQTKRLLVGLPRNMNGTIGPQAERIMEFSRALEGAGFEVRHQVERMNTLMARRVLMEGEQCAFEIVEGRRGPTAANINQADVPPRPHYSRPPNSPSR